MEKGNFCNCNPKSSNKDYGFTVLCMGCKSEVINNKCKCAILVITPEEFERLCKTDQNKLKEIMRKLGKQNG